MAKLFVVVVYDVSNDKRRTKLYKELKKFGTAVQFSAFECLVTSKEVEQMEAVIKDVVDCDKDKVRLYSVCNSCYGRVKNIGTGVISSERDTIII